MKGIKWLNASVTFGVPYAFCATEKAWNKTMKQFEFDRYIMPQTDACCTTFENMNNARNCCIVTINKRIDSKTDPITVAALVMHECVHVAEFVFKQIQEDKPGEEVYAYTLQAISLEVMSAYRKMRKIKSLGASDN